MTFLGYGRDSHNLEGNRVTITALQYEGTIIIYVEKTVNDNIIRRFVQAYTGAVDIMVSTFQENPPVFLHRIFFTLENRENYSFTVPFETEELALIIKTEKKNLNLKIKTQIDTRQ